MIELNILKGKLEKFRKKRVLLNFFILYFGGLVFILLILSMNFMSYRMQLKRIQSDISEIEQRLSMEKETIRLVERRSRETDRLLKILALFIEESEQRILWTDKLAFIGRNVPPSIWLSRLSSSASAGDAGKSRILTIEGYILPDISGERVTIDAFVTSLGRSDLFRAVTIHSIQRTLRERREVVSFSISCELPDIK